MDTVVTELIAAGFLPKRFLAELSDGYPIHISVASDALNYVLESEGKCFEGSAVLRDDVDGQMLGCNCDDLNYCTRP